MSKSSEHNFNNISTFHLEKKSFKSPLPNTEDNILPWLKVETINDSYMVASGLPERNGDRHAAEIASLCLELMVITPAIMIHHDPGLRLRIRSPALNS